MFSPTSARNFQQHVITAAAVAWLSISMGDVCAQEKPADSRFPIVVREPDVRFSIPNAEAKHASDRKAVAAEPFLPKEIYQRTAQPILDATDLIAEGFANSVVEVRNKDQRLGLGTVVSLKGHVLTKYSLIQDLEKNSIRLGTENTLWSGTLIGINKDNDLALFALHSGDLRPEKALRPIAFTTSGRLSNGKIVFGIGSQSNSLSVGMTTAPPELQSINRDCETCIDMGLTLDATMKLTRVYPRTVGERLGLLVGDRLTTVNRQPVHSPAGFSAMEKEIQVGDLISITFLRNGQAFEITSTVPALTEISKRDRWGGGPFSKRRSGFSDVLVHDSVVDPIDCGGPLVNLRGQFCGINIARSMRVATLTIPAESVQEFLLRYLHESDLVIER